jgi:hypothetical protein
MAGAVGGGRRGAGRGAGNGRRPGVRARRRRAHRHRLPGDGHRDQPGAARPDHSHRGGGCPAGAGQPLRRRGRGARLLGRALPARRRRRCVAERQLAGHLPQREPGRWGGPAGHRRCRAAADLAAPVRYARGALARSAHPLDRRDRPRRRAGRPALPAPPAQLGDPAALGYPRLHGHRLAGLAAPPAGRDVVGRLPAAGRGADRARAGRPAVDTPGARAGGGGRRAGGPRVRAGGGAGLGRARRRRRAPGGADHPDLAGGVRSGRAGRERVRAGPPARRRPGPRAGRCLRGTLRRAG